MNNAFEGVYGRLNQAQKQAVDTIEGPVLVIAGPGTGKTQLLSARVANIMRRTDTPAHNILCLTFTESGAANMRERLSRFIGTDAYNVTIGTYHAFGGDLIQRYPEYFNESPLLQPIDDLTKRQVLVSIVEAMSYDNPLKQLRHHLGDLMSTISEVKRALLKSRALQAVAAENIGFITAASADISDVFASFKTMPGYTKALPYFQQALDALQTQAAAGSSASPYGSLAGLAIQELRTALETAEATEKTRPLTDWKNNWLVKDENNNFILGGELENRRLQALADVVEQYENALRQKGLYDFDDMIIRSIEALENNPDLRYTLQEKYLYILLDEFQDTNAAQLKLVELLTDNPIHEGRPNIMAVGDDDQAIYAFQGAQYSNMLDFLQTYRDVAVINLTENYRSQQDILYSAQNVARQIEGRLDKHFSGMTKVLTAANTQLPPASIERVSFRSPISERDWTARRVKQLIDGGTRPSEIAVLAPKHKYLEPLVPYLNSRQIPVRYEKRENILDAPVIKQLIAMSRLVLALQNNNDELANAYWPEVLSYDCWDIPVEKIWRIGWSVRSSDQTGSSWSQKLLDDPELRGFALLFLAAASKAGIEDLETMLDYLTGSREIEAHDPELSAVRSPLQEYCCSQKIQQEQPELFTDTISHLAVLRAKLRDYQNAHESALMLPDLIAFVELYEQAEQQITNTSPHNQQDDSVQLMTVYKAKGLEYEHVFLIHCQDEVWGSSARSNGNKLTLPANLLPIRYQGGGDDEKLRLLFVAITRAKQGLHLSSSEQQYSGKPSARLKYLDEREQDDKTYAALVLPESCRSVVSDDSQAPSQELLQLDWRTRHLEQLENISLKSLLGDRLEAYQLSPTHLLSFIDLEYAGPRYFFLNTILGLPEAPSVDGQYGTAMHETLEWLQYRVSEQSFLPEQAQIIEKLRERISSKKLTPQRTALEIERGEKALKLWLKERQKIFAIPAVVERSFKHEGILLDGVRMSGRIDRMEIDDKKKTITVVDYKTGKSFGEWGRESKLHKYRLQLYAYKLLIENSRTYKGYQVTSGRLEFVEPDDYGRIQTLELQFNEQDLEHTKALIRAMWSCIQNLDFPDTATYPATLKGIEQFEQYLLQNAAAVPAQDASGASAGPQITLAV